MRNFDSLLLKQKMGLAPTFEEIGAGIVKLTQINEWVNTPTIDQRSVAIMGFTYHLTIDEIATYFVPWASRAQMIEGFNGFALNRLSIDEVKSYYKMWASVDEMKIARAGLAKRYEKDIINR